MHTSDLSVESTVPVAATYPRVSAVLVIGLALAVMIGWMADIPLLKSFIPGLIEMKFNTALCFALAGASLWLQAALPVTTMRRRLGQACAALVCLLGTASLAEWMFDWNLHIDQALFIEPASAVYTSAPGRMAPNTAINFICDGLALCFVDWRWGRMRPAQILCLIEIVLALLALLVYVYGVGTVYGMLQFTPMAAHTAIGFLVLSTGILWSRADTGPMTLITSRSSGGVLVRRLLPAVVLAPLLIAWLCLQGIHTGVIDASFAFAVFAVAMIVLLAVPIWFNAQAVFTAEAERLRQIRMATEHAAKLAQVNTDLRQLQSSKDLLTGMIIHDLRNPLSACLGHLEMAQGSQVGTDSKITRHLAGAQDAGRRLLDMINGIIDIIRMEDGKMPTTMADTDVSRLIDAKIAQYQGAATRSGLTLEHRAAVTPIRFRTDGVLLDRVIDNLLVNALKHTPRGGSVAVISTPSPSQDRLTIKIVDTGEGIAADNLGRLFQKYGRIEGQTMGRKYDTGLGLVFCRMAADLLHGSIDVTSELGKGSTFTIELRTEQAR